uniref:Uncharacterized protein n=1 Tax=Rhodosorus marinus TaxID=101924 RepID=A0A6T6P2Y5_9RHOD|mmetsp:Transcript_24615/g.35479  ORF Transcript_24615/g.35479 Transcript_24615/m.35479 type:complete len:128 (+) Transcript_24615:184-567(+)
MEARTKDRTVMRDIFLVGTLGLVFVAVCSLFLMRSSRVSYLQVTISAAEVERATVMEQILDLRKEMQVIMSEKRILERKEKNSRSARKTFRLPSENFGREEENGREKFRRSEKPRGRPHVRKKGGRK